MKTLIAKKIGMTQIFDEESNAKGVTVLDISGCRVVQIKSTEKDGYAAAQLTIGSKKRSTNQHSNILINTRWSRENVYMKFLWKKILK